MRATVLMPRFTVPRIAHCNGGELPLDWVGAFLIGIITLPYQWWVMLRQQWQDRKAKRQKSS